MFVSCARCGRLCDVGDDEEPICSAECSPTVRAADAVCAAIVALLLAAVVIDLLAALLAPLSGAQ